METTLPGMSTRTDLLLKKENNWTKGIRYSVTGHMSPIKGECSIDAKKSRHFPFKLWNDYVCQPQWPMGFYEIEVRSNMIIFTMWIAKSLLYLMRIVCKRFWRAVWFVAGKNWYRRKQEEEEEGKKIKKRKEKKRADSSSSIAALLLRIRQRRLGSRVKRTSGVKRVENLCGILCSLEGRHCGVHSTFLLG